MKVAYFDCQFGAAGDMLLGALLDAGLDRQAWLSAVQKIALPPDSFRITIRKVTRATIAATKVDATDSSGIALDDYPESLSPSPNPAQDEPLESHSHTHAHLHLHPHTHAKTHAPSAAQPEPEHPSQSKATPLTGSPSTATAGKESTRGQATRRLSDCLEIIETSALTPLARELARGIFHRLAQAEASVHGVSPEAVHFHEVGATDALVDIIGFAIAYDLMGIEKSFVSALPLGQGVVETAHGLFPVPAPAVVHLLSQAKAPTSPLNVDYECLTPTGAAILCQIACQFGKQPAFCRIDATGYGAGSTDSPRIPNVCRAILGEAAEDSADIYTSKRFACESIAQVEANLDDFSPQSLSFVLERLFEAGALDVAVLPEVMKKGRAGHVLSVLCRLSERVKIQEMILRETSSIGCRWFTCQRLVAEREWQEVQLATGQGVRIKVARDLDGVVVNAQPEYEDCAAYASRHRLPIKDVIVEAMTKFLRESGGRT